VAFENYGRFARLWKKRPHDKPLRVALAGNVRAENMERVGMFRARKKLDLAYRFLWGNRRLVRRCFCSAQLNPQMKG